MLLWQDQKKHNETEPKETQRPSPPWTLHAFGEIFQYLATWVQEPERRALPWFQVHEVDSVEQLCITQENPEKQNQ